MINLNEIKTKIQEKEIVIFEGETPDDILSSGFKFNTLDEFLKFCEIQNIKSCFIHSQYTEINEHLITKDLIEENVHVDSMSLKHRIIDKILPAASLLGARAWRNHS